MTTWHLDRDLADRYTDGRVGGALAASVEQHLVACADCRGLIRPASLDTVRLDAVWSEVLEQVEAPRVGLLERLLRTVGVSGSTARLVAATPTLRGAWVIGVCVVLLLALVASHASPRGTAVFVALAPVLPLAGVALAFNPRTDPFLELAAASPYSLLRLLLARTAFVVGSTLLPAALLTPLLPDDRWLTVGWLLPALAMSTVVLALAHRVEPFLSATVLAGGWLALSAWRMTLGTSLLVEHTSLVQIVSAVAFAVAAAHLVTHRHDLVPSRRSHA
jgi:hypothetical protein